MLIHKHEAKDKQEALKSLNQHVAMRLVQIEDTCRNYGLPSMTKFTLIARDPDNDNMCVVVTNEDEDGLKDAVRVALNNATIETP